MTEYLARIADAAVRPGAAVRPRIAGLFELTSSTPEASFLGQEETDTQRAPAIPDMPGAADPGAAPTSAEHGGPALTSGRLSDAGVTAPRTADPGRRRTVPAVLEPGQLAVDPKPSGESDRSTVHSASADSYRKGAGAESGPKRRHVEAGRPVSSTVPVDRYGPDGQTRQPGKTRSPDAEGQPLQHRTSHRPSEAEPQMPELEEADHSRAVRRVISREAEEGAGGPVGADPDPAAGLAVVEGGPYLMAERPHASRLAPFVSRHSTPAQPTVQVTIGRVEVRAAPATPGTPRRVPDRPAAMSLDDYLHGREAER